MAIHSSTLLPSSFGGAKHSKPKLLKSCSLPSNPPPLVSFPYLHCHLKALRISASVSVSNPEVRTGPDDLVASILSKECFGALGRLVFKTKEMIQVVEAPETVRNKVSFSAFGFLHGEVSLTGTLTALDDRWIRVVFEPPELRIGALEFRYGGQSEVKLQITYLDDQIRLGRALEALYLFSRGAIKLPTLKVYHLDNIFSFIA